jgi:hypothetical protein
LRYPSPEAPRALSRPRLVLKGLYDAVPDGGLDPGVGDGYTKRLGRGQHDSP